MLSARFSAQVLLITALISSYTWAITVKTTVKPSALSSITPRQGYSQLDWSNPAQCMGDDGHQAYLTFSYCNDCSIGFCDQTTYESLYDSPGSFGNGGCDHDIVVADFDPCVSVAGYQFSTWTGLGNYTRNSEPCNTGAIVGEIITESGYTMSCVKLEETNTEYDTYCGVDYICNAFLQCLGISNPEVCS